MHTIRQGAYEAETQQQHSVADDILLKQVSLARKQLLGNPNSEERNKQQYILETVLQDVINVWNLRKLAFTNNPELV